MDEHKLKSILDSFIEVRLPNNENFLKIKETLTRIGVSSKLDNKLFQSCHILYKQNKYYLVHFKELFKLDNRKVEMSAQDYARRNVIAQLLSDWGLLEIVDPDKIKDNVLPINKLKIVAFADKQKWTLIPKYNIGKYKGN